MSVMIAPTSARAEIEAKELGLDVVYPAPNQLQIDIDSEADYETFIEVNYVLKNFIGVTHYEEKPSRSGWPKKHITLTLDRDVTNLERILLQACLGSDGTREFLSYVQEINKDPHPTLFLEKKPDQLSAEPKPLFLLSYEGE
jgi:hypothetical protein